MHADRAATWRFFLAPLVLTVAGYAAFWSCDRHLRQRHGPWEITFDRAADGAPQLRVVQPRLGRAATITFAGESAGAAALPAVVAFDVPRRAVPFGTNTFEDLTYLPGNVTLQAFGHEVQFLPRTLVVNRREVAWADAAALVLRPEDKPATLALPTDQVPRRPAPSPAAPPR
jgi:hypothetical protein